MEALQHVVELNLGCKLAIPYPHNHLSKDLDQPDAIDFSVTLWDKDIDLSGALLCEVTLAEAGLDQENNHLPLWGVQGLLPSRRPEPGPEMLRYHSGQA